MKRQQHYQPSSSEPQFVAPMVVNCSDMYTLYIIYIIELCILACMHRRAIVLGLCVLRPSV